MKNGLLRFYLLFMFMSLALFSCENHEITQFNSGTTEAIQKKSEERQPVEPNGSPVESQKGKKSPRKYYSRSMYLC